MMRLKNIGIHHINNGLSNNKSLLLFVIIYTGSWVKDYYIQIWG